MRPALLGHRVRGAFWDAVSAMGGTLVVTREYEHLVVAITVRDGRPRLSYISLPHPNGLAVDQAGGRLYVASTRNPNLVYEFAPCRESVGSPPSASLADALLPVRCRFLPGSLYIHDLALIGGRLYANAVSMNAVVELPEGGGFRPAWWPASIEEASGPRWDRNYLQLNSIAAGPDLESSFFSASAAAPSGRRPGHLNFPVDGRGVIFSGRTREVVARGLTRPHSARLARGTLWVANSGYGDFGRIVDGRLETLARLPGWTRGVCCVGRVAFVGTSRILPRFRHYAPGVDPLRTETGLHAVDLRTGDVLGSLIWPTGDQIFAIEACRGGVATVGFPFTSPAEQRRGQQLLFAGSPFRSGVGRPTARVSRHRARRR